MPVEKADAPASAQVQIEQSEVITFPDGLVGCENWRRFVLLSMPDDDLVKVLRCLDEPEVSFLVTDPRLIVTHYQCPIAVGDAEAVKLNSLEDALLLCTLTVHDDPTDITANLLGPLLVNSTTRVGRQLVLSDSQYSTRHPIPRGDSSPAPEDVRTPSTKAPSTKARQAR